MRKINNCASMFYLLISSLVVSCGIYSAPYKIKKKGGKDASIYETFSLKMLKDSIRYIKVDSIPERSFRRKFNKQNIASVKVLSKYISQFPMQLYSNEKLFPIRILADEIELKYLDGTVVFSRVGWPHLEYVIYYYGDGVFPDKELGEKMEEKGFECEKWSERVYYMKIKKKTSYKLTRLR